MIGDQQRAEIVVRSGVLDADIEATRPAGTPRYATSARVLGELQVRVPAIVWRRKFRRESGGMVPGG